MTMLASHSTSGTRLHHNNVKQLQVLWTCRFLHTTKLRTPRMRSCWQFRRSAYGRSSNLLQLVAHHFATRSAFSVSTVRLPCGRDVCHCGLAPGLSTSLLTQNWRSLGVQHHTMLLAQSSHQIAFAELEVRDGLLGIVGVVQGTRTHHYDLIGKPIVGRQRDRRASLVDGHGVVLPKPRLLSLAKQSIVQRMLIVGWRRGGSWGWFGCRRRYRQLGGNRRSWLGFRRGRHRRRTDRWHCDRRQNNG